MSLNKKPSCICILVMIDIPEKDREQNYSSCLSVKIVFLFHLECNPFLSENTFLYCISRRSYCSHILLFFFFPKGQYIFPKDWATFTGRPIFQTDTPSLPTSSEVHPVLHRLLLKYYVVVQSLLDESFLKAC